MAAPVDRSTGGNLVARRRSEVKPRWCPAVLGAARPRLISSSILRKAPRLSFSRFSGFLCETRTPGKAAAGTARRRMGDGRGFRHVMKCHVPPRFVAAGLSPFTAGRVGQTILYTMFFAPALPSEAAPPARTAQTAARRKRILFIYCSYASVKRILRRRRSGSGLGISPAKGQGPRRRPMFRLFRVSQRNPLQRGKCRSESGGDGGDPECCQNRFSAVRGWRRANPTRRAKSAPTSPSEEGEEQRHRIGTGLA